MKSYLLKLKDLNLTIQEVEFQIKFLILIIIIIYIYSQIRLCNKIYFQTNHFKNLSLRNFLIM
jgi:hypothetical protein